MLFLWEFFIVIFRIIFFLGSCTARSARERGVYIQVSVGFNTGSIKKLVVKGRVYILCVCNEYIYTSYYIIYGPPKEEV